MGYNSYPFTWSNKWYDPHYIEERLDMFLYCKNWSDDFQDLIVANLVNEVSNHCPLLIEVKERCKERSYVKKSLNRDHYKDMWSSYKACKNIVKDEWAKFEGRIGENPVQQFQKLAKSSLAKLKFWAILNSRTEKGSKIS